MNAYALDHFLILQSLTLQGYEGSPHHGLGVLQDDMRATEGE